MNTSQVTPAGNKPTNHELEERIQKVKELLSEGLVESQIKAALRAEFGPISSRTIARYLTRAREEMQAANTRPRAELRAESAEFYLKIVRDPKATIREKILSRQRYDALNGLDEPSRTEISGPGGDPIKSAQMFIIDPERERQFQERRKAYEEERKKETPNG